ncbi:ABC transporter substrate-binding protein [Lyngbya confervoides]|uniref:ABC transporter substrate-binding protein n=1 Tax=Lyngbya confervoides BDU141951 TaxID=1574623 RepID=A0ABD4T449_9CYAN|nr:ABC transporter substrate-binding protein [Lyngbya confervoides]MCM1983201.1 ABC transporter substrate-binding protein [Lyngbya confervoides BDU141951]
MNPRRSLGWTGCLALFLLGGLWGCRSWLNTTRPPGSQLVLATLSDPKTFNYALNQEFPNVFLFTYAGLTGQNGATGEIEPALAESWQISEDRTRITFVLRQGLKWSDGTPLTAADVVFTYESIVFNPRIPTDMGDSLRIGPQRQFPTVRQLDDHRVEFTTSEPFAPFLRTTVGPPEGVAILPKHRLSKAVNTLDPNGNPQFISTWGTDTNPQEIVGNGPYVIQHYDPGQRVVFRRNPHYWRRDDQGTPLPYIDRVIWQIMESTDTQLLSFRAQDLDVMGDSRPLRPEYYSLLKAEEKIRNHRMLVGGPWSGTTFLAFNLNQGRTAQGRPLVDPVKSAWFQDRRFRQAIAHGINRPKMLNNLFQGIGVVQNSPISVQSPYYRSPEQGLKAYDYNLETAKSLLQAAGFTPDDQGRLRDRSGNRVRFSLLTNSGNKLREAMGAQVKQDLSELGIQVDFAPIAFNALVNKITVTRDWETHILGFSGGLEPHNGANLWTSQGGSHLFNLAQQPGQPPLAGWVATPWEQRIDQLFVAGAQTFEESQRRQIYGEFQAIVQEQVPMVYLVNEMALMVARDRVQGLEYSGLPTWGLWNIAQLRVTEARPTGKRP